MTRVLPTDAGYTAVSTNWASINGVSCNVQLWTLQNRNAVCVYEMTAEGVLLLEHLTTYVALQSSLCKMLMHLGLGLCHVVLQPIVDKFN